MINFERLKEKTDEHMDDTIRGSIDSVDRRLHCVPCSRSFDPLVAGVRGDLSDLAFRNGSTSGVARPGARPADHLRASFAHAPAQPYYRVECTLLRGGVSLSMNVELIHRKWDLWEALMQRERAKPRPAQPR